MQIEKVGLRTKGRGSIRDYIQVIKPRETGLLVFIGVITALVANGGSISIGRFVFIMAAILIASAGANGLTNYLDRDLDARMARTCRRALPARRIYPAERALVYTAALTTIGLVMAWYLHPLAFLADLVGTASAIIYRKKVTCVFPQGMIASWAPVLMGWFAVRSTVTWEILLLCVLISVWLPSHIWSIMTAHKEEYRSAGITYSPVSSSLSSISRILFGFSLLLLAASIGLYFAGDFGWIYLGTAITAGIIIVIASLRLMLTGASSDAWKLYKLSAFPYLGVLFLAMGIDILVKL